MSSGSIEWLAAASPPGFKAIFLGLIVLIIPSFFVVMWLVNRKHKDKKK